MIPADIIEPEELKTAKINIKDIQDYRDVKNLLISKIERQADYVDRLNPDELSYAARSIVRELEESYARIGAIIADARSQHIFNYTQGKLFDG